MSPAWLDFAPTTYVCAGAPGTTRTCDPQLRKLVLYPTELRAPAHFPLAAGDNRPRRDIYHNE